MFCVQCDKEHDKVERIAFFQPRVCADVCNVRHKHRKLRKEHDYKDDKVVALYDRKPGRVILLIGMLCCLTLAGCGSKDSVNDESTVRGTVDSGEPAEDAPTVDEEKEALEAELAEAKAELAKAQEALAESEEDAIEAADESEEAERLIVTEVSEEELKQAEYLANLRATADNWAYNQKKYKFTYYADDINKDGFPELLMFGDRNTGRGVEQELYYIFLIYQEHWNEETRRNEQLAVVDGLTGVFYSNTDTVPESGVLELSYTDDGSNIERHTYSSRIYSSGSGANYFANASYVIEDEVCIYKDNELLHNGERTIGYFEFDYKEPEFRYLTRDANYRTWSDEESYNNFVIPECDKTVRLTARSGWGTVDEALEHLGELP